MTCKRMSMPITEWPATDRALLEALRQTGGLFDDPGELAHLRLSSMPILIQSWGRFLEWLRLNDPVGLAEPPVDRATLPRLRAWLTAESDLRPTSRLMFFAGVLRLLQAAAPDEDWSGHRRVKADLERLAGRGDPARKAGRILDSRVLLEAALRHAGPELDREPTALQRAKRLRDAAMVALLAMMPIRHRAFAALQLGTSVRVEARGLTIMLSDELTKTSRHWEADIPEPAAALLRRYLSEARPFLLARRGKQHDMLWAGNAGDPMSYSYVGRRIPQITQALTGVAIPPHFFPGRSGNDSGAELAPGRTADPTGAGPCDGQDGRTTLYPRRIHAGTIEASRDFAALLRQLKKDE